MIDETQLKQILAGGESARCEFKSDRQQISNSTIYEEVVAFANADGGLLLIGVEDDGVVSGAKPRHGRTTEPAKLQAAIRGNTVPSIEALVSVVDHPGGSVIAIQVPPCHEPCATGSGKSLRRAGGPNGPQTVPFYPRDHLSRRVDLGLLDFSAQVLSAASFDSLDPLCFERLRQTITALHGDRNLLGLSNSDLAKALRLGETREGRLIPNLAGMLLLGRRDALATLVPTHQVFFQVLDGQNNVKVNTPLGEPLIHVLQELESRFVARNEEREVSAGFIRLPIPDYSLDGFREAVNNAVLHRDYARHDAVYVQWLPDQMFIASPGGFPEGITMDNILVHEPKPRNPRLAEAFRRIGLIEQTGRGVDKIFMGQLRYGRPAPDYSRSDSTGVRVVLRGGQASLEFAAFVLEQEKQGSPLTLDELLVLNTLFFERRIDTERTGRLIQKSPSDGRSVLERLHEKGMIEARGEKRGRVYHLAADLYRRFAGMPAYVRSRGFDRIQQEQMILNAVAAEGRITRKKTAELCRITEPQAYRLLSNLASKNELQFDGKGRGAHYVRKRTP